MYDSINEAFATVTEHEYRVENWNSIGMRSGGNESVRARPIC